MFDYFKNLLVLTSKLNTKCVVYDRLSEDWVHKTSNQKTFITKI